MSRWPVSSFNDAAERIDRRLGWHRLPLPLAIPTLIGLRDRLREKNLYDTGRGPARRAATSTDHPRYLTARTLDGTLQRPRRPADGQPRQPLRPQRPARATPYREPTDALLEPNPRTVSRELLTRDEFIPATTLNLLAGAWIQFEVHDWFSHGKNEAENPWQVELAEDDPWPEHPMQIQRTRRDPSADPDGPADLRHRRHALVGRLADLRPRPGVRATRSAPASTASCGSTSTGLPPSDARGAHRPRPASPATSGSASRCCTRCSCASTTRSATTCTSAPGARRRRALRQGAARHRGADGEDPHRRLDAGDHRAPDDGARAARELVGPRGRAARQAARPR